MRTDLDHLLNRTLAREAEDLRIPPERWATSVTGRVRPRRLPLTGPAPSRWRSVAVAAAAAALLAAALAAPLWTLSRLGSGPETRPGSSPTPEAELTYADLDDGLRIRVPASWTFHQDPSGPAEPKTVFATGSWPFPEGGECAPMPAMQELPPDGALIWLLEYRTSGDPSDFPERPDRFALDEDTYGSYECSVVPSYLIRFRDAGREFQVHVAFGGEAAPSTREATLRALDSVEVTAPVPEGCPTGVGPWSDPDCPMPTWVRAVVDRAGYRVTGDTGSALVAEGLGGEFSIWANEADPGLERRLLDEGYRRAFLIGEIQTFSDGVRMVWVAQGLAVWVAGWQVGEPAPGEPPPGPIVADLVEASQRVDYDAIDTRP